MATNRPRSGSITVLDRTASVPHSQAASVPHSQAAVLDRQAAVLDRAVDPEPRPARRTARQRTIRLLGLLAVGAIAAVVLRDKLPAGRDVLRAFSQADPRWLLLAAAAQAISMEMFARQQSSLLHGFGLRLSAARSRAITYARTAISVTMPVGSVVSAGFAFTQWRAKGATRAVAASVMVLSGVASFGGLAGLLLVGSGAALAVRPMALQPVALHPPILAALAGCLSALALLGVLIRRRRQVRRRRQARTTVAAATAGQPAAVALPRRWVGRLRSSAALERLRLTAVQAARAAAAVPRRYALAALAFASLNWLTDLICLLITARALHLQLGLLSVTGVYLAVQIVRQVPLTPGGVGLIETSLLAGLVAAGAAYADAGAAVLTYRLLSCWLIVPIGAATWVVLRRASRAPNRSPEPLSTTDSTTPLPSGRLALERLGRGEGVLHRTPLGQPQRVLPVQQPPQQARHGAQPRPGRPTPIRWRCRAGSLTETEDHHCVLARKRWPTKG